MKTKTMARFLALLSAAAASGAPAWALGGASRLSMTAGVSNLAAEISGPIAYALSVICVVGGCAGLIAHQGEVGSAIPRIAGVVLVCGGILGAASLLSLVPGVGGAII